MQERAPRASRGGRRHVGVVQDDQGGVAAELQVRSLEVPGGEFADAAADRGRAGEADDPHQRVGDQRLADVGAAGQHVQQAVGQAGLLEDPGEDDAAGDRRARVRLEHDRVAERERRGDRADGQDLREVERRDHANHADRHPLGEAEARLLARQQLAVGAGRERGRLVDLLDGHVGLELGGGADLAGLPDHPALDLGGVLLPESGRPAKDRGPLGVRRGRPGRLRLARLPDRAGNVGRGRDADAAELIPVAGSMTAAAPPSEVIQPPEYTWPFQVSSLRNAMIWSRPFSCCGMPQVCCGSGCQARRGGPPHPSLR